MRTEPVAVIGAIVGVIGSIFPMLILFGVLDWTEQQLAGVLLVVDNLAILAGVVWARSKVSPVGN